MGGRDEWRGRALIDTFTDSAPLYHGCLSGPILFPSVLLLTILSAQDWICEIIHPLGCLLLALVLGIVEGFRALGRTPDPLHP